MTQQAELASEETIAITTRIYACRDSAVLILGDQYGDRMRVYGEKIQAAMSQWGCATITAALRLAEEDASAMEALLVLAAACEMVDPLVDAELLSDANAEVDALYRCCATAEALLGDRYLETMENYGRDILQSRQDGESVLAAGKRLAADQDNKEEAMLVLAATTRLLGATG